MPGGAGYLVGYYLVRCGLFHFPLTISEVTHTNLAGIAEACPGIRELSVLPVSLFPQPPFFRVTDIASTNFRAVPPQNKQHKRKKRVNLPTLTHCISAFGNLSTIRLISCPYVLIPDSRWNEAKDLAIRQLKGSPADGPKRLKTMVLLPGMWTLGGYEPELVVEEIVV